MAGKRLKSSEISVHVVYEDNKKQSTDVMMRVLKIIFEQAQADKTEATTN